MLALHLKRFKYVESLGRHRKLMHRVVFPTALRLRNTTDDAPAAEALYFLFAVVVHVGSGPNHGAPRPQPPGVVRPRTHATAARGRCETVRGPLEARGGAHRGRQGTMCAR